MIVAIPYLRVSTDDKGQRPERQLAIIAPWAAREGVALLAPEIDEGTSASKTGPFDRPRFVAACERARALGAGAIVVETADRFTREGAKLDAWAEVELERRYGLRLLRADKPLEQHGTLVGDATDGLKAGLGREWATEHGRKVKSGMAHKREKAGAKYGRPAKDLTEAELELVRQLRSQGWGWRRCALAVSAERGAFRIADPEKRRKATVSHSHVRRQLEEWNKTHSGTKGRESPAVAADLQDTL